MVITKRVKRFIAIALEESTRSTYGRISIGAVIADGSYLVSRGCNTTRTHPIQQRLNVKTNRSCTGACLHAELNALLKARDRNLRGCEIFVARFDRRGNLSNCKPCVACEQAIRDSGISRCYFTNQFGVQLIEYV